MTPTMELRFVEREIEVPAQVDWDHATWKTVRVLQQKWTSGTSINIGFGDIPVDAGKTEWRDVPLVKEQT